MKFFKNVFGSKENKTSKYEPNTLAETNGSPDMRLATSKEREPEVPIIMKEEVKKIPKKSASTTQKKVKSQQPKIADAEPIATENKVNKTATKSTKENAEKAVEATQKAAKSAAKVTSKKAGEMVEAKPEKVTKTAAAKKESEPQDAAKKGEKKVAEKKTVSPVEDVKKEVKSANVAKKDATTEAPKKTKTATKKTEEKREDAPAIEESPTAKSARTGKFEIKKSKDGRFVFNLYASNSVIVATSQVYSSSTAAMNGIKSVIANAATAPIEDQTLKSVTTVPFPKWEIYLDKGEQYRFRLCASNGSCVCHSQGYTSKANCKNGIESIIKSSANAEIDKAYLDKKEK